MSTISNLISIGMSTRSKQTKPDDRKLPGFCVTISEIWCSSFSPRRPRTSVPFIRTGRLIVYLASIFIFATLIFSDAYTTFHKWLLLPDTSLARNVLFEVIDVVEATGLEHFVTEGTLLGLLRYGASEGVFPGQKCNFLDNDFDIMIRVESKSHFHDVVRPLITQQLVKKGWLHCLNRHADKLTCYREKVLGWRVDFYSFYEKDGKLRHFEMADPFGEEFWKKEWPPPQELIYPLKECLAYGRRISCPGRALEFILHAKPSMGSDMCEVAMPDSKLSTC
eukprot:536210_1